MTFRVPIRFCPMCPTLTAYLLKIYHGSFSVSERVFPFRTRTVIVLPAASRNAGILARYSSGLRLFPTASQFANAVDGVCSREDTSSSVTHLWVERQ